MNFVRKNLKWIITIIGVIIVTTGISVYATSTYLASQVEYNKNGQAYVSDALDDLYSKVPSGTESITANGTYNIANKESVNVNVTVAGTKTLLWTNSSPNNSFGKETVTLSSSMDNFSHLLIQYKSSTTSTEIYEDLFKISPYRLNNFSDGTGVYAIGCWGADSSIISRTFRYVDSNNLRFGGAAKMNLSNTEDFTRLIPLNIYGLNFSY